jgi:hypothetical protein
MKIKAPPITRHKPAPACRWRGSLVTILVMMAGCATQPAIVESNYLTYDHAFTDAAALAAQRSAEKVCAERKQVAVKTRSVCSLKECTTHYQCMDRN